MSWAGDEQDEEANIFARVFLASVPVLHECGINTIGRICRMGLLPDEETGRHFVSIETGYVKTSVTRKLTGHFDGFIRQHNRDNRKRKVLLSPLGIFIVCGAIISCIVTIGIGNLCNYSITAITPVITSAPLQVKGKSIDSKKIVWVAPKGTVYHNEWCYHIEGKSTARSMRIEDASLAGLHQCKKCTPDTRDIKKKCGIVGGMIWKRALKR